MFWPPAILAQATSVWQAVWQEEAFRLWVTWSSRNPLTLRPRAFHCSRSFALGCGLVVVCLAGVVYQLDCGQCAHPLCSQAHRALVCAIFPFLPSATSGCSWSSTCWTSMVSLLATDTELKSIKLPEDVAKIAGLSQELWDRFHHGLGQPPSVRVLAMIPATVLQKIISSLRIPTGPAGGDGTIPTRDPNVTEVVQMALVWRV